MSLAISISLTTSATYSLKNNILSISFFASGEIFELFLKFYLIYNWTLLTPRWIETGFTPSLLTILYIWSFVCSLGVIL
jgi:hypothetical protein